MWVSHERVDHSILGAEDARLWDEKRFCPGLFDTNNVTDRILFREKTFEAWRLQMVV